MFKRTWTQADESFLENKWGKLSYNTLSKKFNKTEEAIKLKAKRLGLPGIYNTGEYLNARNIAEMLNVDRHTITDYWVPKCHLKAKKRALRNDRRWFIKLEVLLKWLEDNRDKWDSRKVKLYALGVEPKWLKEKRKQDLKLPKRKNQKWTEEETGKLIFYYRHGRTYKYIGKLLERSENSVERKLYRLREKGII